RTRSRPTLRTDAHAPTPAAPRDPVNNPSTAPTATGMDHIALYIDTSNDAPIRTRQDGHVSRRSLAAGSGGESGDGDQPKPTIYLNGDVTIVPGRTPELIL